MIPVYTQLLLRIGLILAFIRDFIAYRIYAQERSFRWPGRFLKKS